MNESEREPPEEKKPLTREDVLRLIEEHGGPKGLDLMQADLRQADLNGLDLHGADLRFSNLQRAHLIEANLEEAVLWGANLQRADLLRANLRGALLREANLQSAHLHRANLVQANLRAADLSFANLERAHLWQADLEGADLFRANLQGAHLMHATLRGAQLWGAELQEADLARADLRHAVLAYAILRDANLEDVDWGDYALGEEMEGKFVPAASAYRALKQRHTDAGMYAVAGVFHYREMEARRKLAWGQSLVPYWLPPRPSRLLYALALYALRFLYGYGERPERVIGWAAAVVFGLAVVHWLFGTVAGGFLNALYYSAVSFTALGYGASASDPQGWAGRFLGAGESFIGIFMLALFLVTFTRKMTR